MSDLLKVLEFYGIEANAKILCPFHADKNPSLQVDLEKDMWYCYGCQEGGGAYKFHKKMQELSGKKDEIKMLMLFNKITKSGCKSQDEHKQIVVNDRAYYRQCLIEAKDFYNGLRSVNWFSKDADEECVEYMLFRGFKRGTLNRVGAKYTYKDVTYPIVFPIKDNGRFKGWVSRSFDVEISSKRKYLYNKGFRRRSTLAGDYKDSQIVMLVEGYMDYLKAYQFGYKKVAAILGWKITDAQVKKLKSEGVKVVISALDNDDCGKRGTDYLKRFFKVVRFQYPKNVKDIGDISKKQFLQSIKLAEGEITNGLD